MENAWYPRGSHVITSILCAIILCANMPSAIKSIHLTIQNEDVFVRILNAIQKLDHFTFNLLTTIQNPDTSWFQIPTQTK